MFQTYFSGLGSQVRNRRFGLAPSPNETCSSSWVRTGSLLHSPVFAKVLIATYYYYSTRICAFSRYIKTRWEMMLIDISETEQCH